MVSNIYKLWLTLSSLLLTLSVYLVKSDNLLNDFATCVEDNAALAEFIAKLPSIVSYLFYFLVVVLFTWISIFAVRFLSHEQLIKGRVETIETANDAFLPSYLGYFFVALSINDISTFMYVFSLIFIFIFFSKISFFNPVFLLFGYRFFNLTNTDGLKIVVITKKDLKIPSDVEFPALKRINNYTFISKE
jgi:hypothetical protein